MTTPNQPDSNPHVPTPRPATPTPSAPSPALDSTLNPSTAVKVDPPAGQLVAQSPTGARPPVRRPSAGR
jgi:hypothetical protein